MCVVLLDRAVAVDRAVVGVCLFDQCTQESRLSPTYLTQGRQAHATVEQCVADLL